jgi:membrane protease YdiL (CAAX protease family)
VSLTAIPWDFSLIVFVLATLVPWRGAVRVKRLLSEDLPPNARLSLYVSTIAYQWLLATIVAWRAFSRGLDVFDLGLTAGDPWRTTWIALGLTVLLCANQFASLRMMARVPESSRGPLYPLTKKIMPRTNTETVVFAVLACTAGLTEEFLYRGFVFVVLARVFENSTYSMLIAGVLSSAWFAVGHLYQGKRGIVTTFIVGLIFISVRYWSRSLIPSMAAHAGIDLIAGLYASRMLRDG